MFRTVRVTKNDNKNKECNNRHILRGTGIGKFLKFHQLKWNDRNERMQNPWLPKQIKIAAMKGKRGTR
jgi:hypothetical protein